MISGRDRRKNDSETSRLSFSQSLSQARFNAICSSEFMNAMHGAEMDNHGRVQSSAKMGTDEECVCRLCEQIGLDGAM